MQVPLLAILGGRWRRVDALPTFRTSQSVEAAINAFFKVRINVKLLLVDGLGNLLLDLSRWRFSCLALRDLFDLHAWHKGRCLWVIQLHTRSTVIV